ncbi:TIGR03086 family metal-binding protein [Streptomyces sp. NPDC006283]|uniref:TIGR03086 family metal-binding protein n=1 Tax=Streptomyces sp. NPDC006283 TaxID=3156741 RepID=UPI0033AAA5FF
MTHDPRTLYARTAAQFAGLLKTVAPGELERSTPCTEYDVRQLISHVVGVTRRFAVIGEGGDGMAVPTHSDGVADEEWSAAFEESLRRATAAWADDAKLAGEYTVPWGRVPGAAAVGGYVMETLAHTWDLSRALGHPVPLDEELALAVLPLAHQALPADRRGEQVPFAAVREAPADADAYGRLAAWLGREV